MNQPVVLLKLFLRILARYKLQSLAALCLVFIALGVAVGQATKSPVADLQQGTASKPKVAAAKTATESESASAPVTTDNPTEQPSSKPVSSASSPAPSAPSSAQKTLIITPSVITVKPGERPRISIKTSDGKAVNMPLFNGSPGSLWLLLNFPAGPAKTLWDGELITQPNTSPKTYTIQIAAQDNKAAFYKGTITLHIVVPTMTIAVQSHGYDPESDSVDYTITINRQHGFSEPITLVAASSNTDPGLGCYYGEIDDNSIYLSCGHESGERPTSGTLDIEVSTASLTRSANVGYSLPAAP